MSYFDFKPEPDASRTASIRPRHDLMRTRRTSMPVFHNIAHRLSTASSTMSFDSVSEEPASPTNASVQSLNLPSPVDPQARKDANRLSLPPNNLAPRPSTPSGLGRLRKVSRRTIKRSVTDPTQSHSSPLDVELRLRNAVKREQITAELVDTERAYVAVLTEIEKHYLEPLNSSSKGPTPILDRAGIADIFCNFTDIIVLAREMLRRLEQGVMPQVILEDEERLSLGRHAAFPRGWKPAAVSCDNPGSLLLPLFPFLKCYSLFVQGFTKSLARLHSEEARNPAFRSFVQERRKRGVGKGIQLAGMLLNVVQRVPRYKLLLADLLAHAEEEHPDRDSLLAAFRIVDEVASHLNKSIMAHEASLKLVELQRSIQNLPLDLVAPGRRLIRSGALVKVCRRDEQVKTFFLFSDFLLYATTRTHEQAHKWSRAVSLSGLATLADSSRMGTRSEVVGAAAGMEEPARTYLFNRCLFLKDVTVVAIEDNYFEVRSPEKSFAVAADTREEKNSWIDAIRTAKEELLSSRRTLQTDSDDETHSNGSSNQPAAFLLKRTGSNISNKASGTPRLSRDFDSPDLTPLQTPNNGSVAAFEATAGSRPSSLSLPPAMPVRRHSEGLISRTKEEVAILRRGLNVADNYSAPVWVPDYKASSCMQCQTPFGLWRRKHHCRLCGSVVCYACSTNTFIVPASLSRTEHIGRSCDTCFSACFDSSHKARHLPLSPTLPDIAARMSLHVD